MDGFNKIVLDDETLEVEDTKARTDIGDIATLKTSAKDSIVKAVNEVFQYASDFKAKIASAITGKGVTTPKDATGDVMAANIAAIKTGTDTSDATATAAQLLSGSTAYAKGSKITGTMADYSGKNLGYPASGETYTDDGTPVTRLYLTNYVAVKKASNSLPLIRVRLGMSAAVNEHTYVDIPVNNFTEGNIKAGVVMGYAEGNIGIKGTFTADATATAAQILEGQIAYVRGSKVTGTIADKGTYNGGCSSATLYENRVYVRFPGGYYHGGSYDVHGGEAEVYIPYPDLASLLGIMANKILAGNTICGVAGNATPRQFASGTVIAAPTSNTKTFLVFTNGYYHSQMDRPFCTVNIGFVPSVVFYLTTSTGGATIDETWGFVSNHAVYNYSGYTYNGHSSGTRSMVYQYQTTIGTSVDLLLATYNGVPATCDVAWFAFS